MADPCLPAYEVTAELIWEDGARWIRLIGPEGFPWDEPVAGWVEIMDLVKVGLLYRHADGRIAAAAKGEG